MPNFGGAWWKLNLPKGWDAQHEPECSSIFPASGYGVFQVSAARKEGSVTDDELREFANEHLSAGAKPKVVSLGDFAGFTIGYRDEEFYSRQWFLRCREIALFVTYNCPIAQKEHEDAVVDSVLASLHCNEIAL